MRRGPTNPAPVQSNQIDTNTVPDGWYPVQTGWRTGCVYSFKDADALRKFLARHFQAEFSIEESATEKGRWCISTSYSIPLQYHIKPCLCKEHTAFRQQSRKVAKAE